ncbi:vacuolar protein sorting-associated protein 41 [Chiua virens]|nr:vacuolar protein sorting-associated protein 41 [Chiua virens]
MLASASGTDKSSADTSSQSVSEKLDDSRAARSNVTEGVPTNGNGNARQDNAAEESEGGTDTGEGGSEDEDDDANERSMDVEVGNDHGNGGEEGDEGNEEDGDGDDDDEEEEEEDEEPSLKYERMGGAVNDLLKKDSASALAVSGKYLALGTHGGIVHVLSLAGERIKSFKPHQASVSDIEMDSTADFVATASIDGQVVVHSLSTPESYVFDMKRPIRTVALEPHFAKRTSRAFVCGGMAGILVLREKGWLGHKETILHSAEGPIWQVRWREHFIAWANDLGVRIYDTQTQSRISFIDRSPDSPRADLFKCTLCWQDDTTLLIAWADHIKVARVRSRPSGGPKLSPWIVEVTAAFQLDCMISGILPHPMPQQHLPQENGTTTSAVTLTSFLILAYEPPDTYGDEMTDDRARQARKTAERPELRIISRSGEELSADALSVTNYQAWGCNDYILTEVNCTDEERCYIVVSPKDIVLVRPRDRKDHIAWLVEHKRYEEALDEVEKLSEAERTSETSDSRIDPVQIGARYIKHLISEGDFPKAARLCPKVCGQDIRKWEEYIFVFAQKYQLQAIIPYVPTASPQLGHLVYEMILGHFLSHDKAALLHMIKEWPSSIYDISAVIVAVQSELDRTTFPPSSEPPKSDATLLIECLADLYTSNRQYGKALPFFLQLRRPNVFDLIREHNLFTDVQDQALLLVEFDQELNEKRKQAGQESSFGQSEAITLLVNHTHSIPVGRVVQQLRPRPLYLFYYLDALFKKDQQLAADFADLQVTLFAEYATLRLIEYLRASNYYNLEAAYNICRSRDLIPEMVFLLGRMGNNKKALTLIIERIGDVQQAIEFAKEQNDDDLWEDLLKYAETRPTFIRGLLENVGAEIDPIRLIRRIKNGLEIPGLKEALIKILHDFQLQISLLEGCQAILECDSTELARIRQRGQNSGFFLSAKALCLLCSEPLLRSPQDLLLLFLCRHVVHANCMDGVDDLPRYTESLDAGARTRPAHEVSAKIAFSSVVRAKVRQGCPVCHRRGKELSM